MTNTWSKSFKKLISRDCCPGSKTMPYGAKGWDYCPHDSSTTTTVKATSFRMAIRKALRIARRVRGIPGEDV